MKIEFNGVTIVSDKDSVRLNVNATRKIELTSYDEICQLADALLLASRSLKKNVSG